jgi:hypothetical protein
LEKRDEKVKRTNAGPRKKYVSTWQIPECDDKGKNRCTTQEDKAILEGNEDSDWAYDESKGEYVLTINGVKVMIIPCPEIFKRLYPFQRDAVKWVANVGPVGGILGECDETLRQFIVMLESNISLVFISSLTTF